mmetsp:Transcript_32553/g.65925  ORF Transcript_32553/g.65925 Transcript_32553/m.65925 type:complete len:163 (+) Transcript_32553:230-718(+)
MPRSYPLLLLSTAITLQSTSSLVPEKPIVCQPKSATTTTRREIFRKVSSATAASASVLVSTAALSPNPAFALKPNNEALCGTGFFTNIAQYKCTDIGDISDEGRSRQMSSEEESKLDSLMGKFDLSGPDLGSGGGGSGSTIDGEGTRSAEDKDAGKQREQGW